MTAQRLWIYLSQKPVEAAIIVLASTLVPVWIFAPIAKGILT